MNKEFICVVCPVGCRLSAVVENGIVGSIRGNACKRGIDYAKQEAVQPMRVLTGLMRSAEDVPIAVKSSGAIPKTMMLECAAELKRHRPALPIKIGDVLLQNICGTGRDILSTVTISRAY